MKTVRKQFVVCRFINVARSCRDSAQFLTVVFCRLFVRLVYIMGKKSRKARAKTKDFQKTKLKVGKKKPLPNNVTEVAFKSRSIYVAEQLTNVAVNHEDEVC